MASSNVKKVKAGVFIDGSNMFWGSRESQIKIDWLKMKQHLEKHYKPQVFNYFGCEDTNPSEQYKEAAERQQKYYNKLAGMGYDIKRKSLKKYGCGDTKCDMDLELVMDLRKYEDDLDCFIIFTGDSDFLPVVEKYWEEGKFIRIYSFEELLSWELKTFAINNPRCNYRIINDLEEVHWKES